MNKNFENFEAKLREIFEEKIIQLIPGNRNRRKLFDDLDDLMQDKLQTNPDGEIQAPDKFIIHVPPEDLSDWKAHQDVLDEMAGYLYQKGYSLGFNFIQPLTIQIQTQNSPPKQAFFITADFSKKPQVLPDTSIMTHDESENRQQNIPDRAYLIVAGKESFPLDQSVINIGRHSENDLVINEPHVSRHHAQLRAINQRYVLFDVGSTGGLMINGKPIPKATLQTGDVIRIGLVNLIYVQDSTSEHSTTALPVEEDLRGLENNNQ